MDSKNIVMLLCLALYFLQCQGADPNEKQRIIIEGLVRKNYKPDGLSYEEVLSIIDDVKRATGATGNPPSHGEYETRLEGRKFAKDEVIEIAQYIVGDDSMTGLVRELFEKNQYPDSISFVILGYVIQGVRLGKNLATFTDIHAQLKTDMISNKQ